MTEYRSGTIDVIVPRSLDDHARRRHIETTVQTELSKTGEWATRIDANTGYGITGDDHHMRWPAHFQTGPIGVTEE